jgi:ABC-type phosphate transport system substrate-binding protein
MRGLIRVGLALMAAATAAANPGSGAAASYEVIVHVGHPGDAVPRAVLADIFLKKAGYWGNGDTIEVVEHSIQSELRAEFSRDLLQMEPGAVMAYWHEQLRRERVRPPAVKASDAEIVEYVASHPGAIGYVGTEAAANGAVKVLQITD